MASVLESIQSFTDSSQRLDEIQEGVGGIKRQLTDSEDRQVLEWLSSSDRGRERHVEIRSRRTPGTGTWILHTPAFRDWIDEASPAKLVWFIGAPGCGKSTLLYVCVCLLYAESQLTRIALSSLMNWRPHNAKTTQWLPTIIATIVLKLRSHWP